MPAKFDRTTDLPNVINAHVNATTDGMVIVRIETVLSQEHIEQIRAGVASPNAIELSIDPSRARTLGQGLIRMAQATIASQTQPKGKH